ncbi:hypothetical protein RB623_22315 [Mesorhizobium sp. LHD-90]|uniref:hypothetical protein n=1 Tax=Mesorhizobium sp. LHD-90 TaxID=3071414 RepID=UPI0027E01017|nr:hypothetical protein [Mesorhizobium sp. LHD-90]MDQ6436795.1 hypothetical protein [Mesorhizobium sp. LHD-90]
MSERAEKLESLARQRRLAEAISDAKNAVADREDVVVELREATLTRLKLLAAELAPVFDEVPAEIDIFDFAISSGLQPRLWIDAVSHVAMGRDRRTYRFVKDTRNGRVVLAESHRMEDVADRVTRYVAERIVERERFLEGDVAPAIEAIKPPAPQPARAAVPEPAATRPAPKPVPRAEPRPSPKPAPAIPATLLTAPAPARAAPARKSVWRRLLSDLGIVIAGLLFGLVAAVVIFWDRLVSLLP